MSDNHFGHCHIYGSYDQEAQAPRWHIRIGSLETKEFPFGISINPSFLDKQEAIDFTKDVNEYLNKAFTCHSCQAKKQNKKLKARRAERKAKIQNEATEQI